MKDLADMDKLRPLREELLILRESAAPIPVANQFHDWTRSVKRVSPSYISVEIPETLPITKMEEILLNQDGFEVIHRDSYIPHPYIPLIRVSKKRRFLVTRL